VRKLRTDSYIYIYIFSIIQEIYKSKYPRHGCPTAGVLPTGTGAMQFI